MEEPRWLVNKRRHQREYKAAELLDPVRGPRRREIQRARHIARMKEDPEYRARKRQQDKEHTHRTTQKCNDDPEYRRATILRHKCNRVGITTEDYAKVWEEQNGKCAICGLPEHRKYKGRVKELSLDHCHRSGKFRALLCHDCNTSIGMMAENPSRLRAAADYLESHIDLA